jgi:iron-sulfur cluster insertion protein
MTTSDIAYGTRLGEPDLRLTPAALAKMTEILAESDPDLGIIRIFVSGGGCGGMGYGMTLSENVTEYDSVLEGPDYKIAIDAVALNFLRGAQIDFANDAFIFNNVFQSVGGAGTCGGCGGGRGF